VFNEEIGSPLNCNNVSIDDFSDDFVVHIYPNPFTNKLTQLNKSGEENYTFINYCGEIIWSGKNIENHDFSYLSTGVYFLKVNNKTIKLIKQ
jgi:hypothetical protein